MTTMRLLVVHLFLTGLLMSVVKINLAQTQKATNNLEVDTVYLKSVESSHFKISLPKIVDLKIYEDVFNTYGKLSVVKIKSKSRQFLGDFKNISRAKYVSGALKRAGLTNTKITLFEIWVPPVIPKKEKEEKKKTVTSQTAIVGEQLIKRKKKKNKITKIEALNPASPNFNKKNKTNPFPTRPKNSEVNIKIQDSKGNIKEIKSENLKTVNTKVSTEKMLENKLSEIKKTAEKIEESKPVKEKAPAKKAKESKPLDADVKISTPKAVAKKPIINNNAVEETKADQFILILPKVNNPEIYQYILKDIGTVDYKKLPNEQWYYFLGFFKDAATAKTILPKIKERGFTSAAKISSLKDAEKTALTMYKNLPPIQLKKVSEKKVSAAIEKIHKELYYSIELPPVDNPEIYFKAFKDIGVGFSELAPNGKGVYYMGKFQTIDMAKAKVAELKERGLSNGIVVKFKNDKRLDAYADIYTKKVEEETVKNVDEIEPKKEVLVKTHPRGSFQIRLKQVENPDVLKSVFEDVGKLKIGYLEDDTEYYFIGNYLFQKEAEKVVAQLKKRGLTKFDLINVMAETKAPEIPAKVSTYKIKLGILKNEQQDLFEPYGTISSIKKEKITEYYLGNYPTKKVANLILQELKELKLEIPYEIKFFAE